MARTLTRPMFRKGGMAQREEYMGGGIKTIRPKYMGGGMTGIMSGIVPDAGLTPRTGFQTGKTFEQIQEENRIKQEIQNKSPFLTPQQIDDEYNKYVERLDYEAGILENFEDSGTGPGSVFEKAQTDLETARSGEGKEAFIADLTKKEKAKEKELIKKGIIESDKSVFKDEDKPKKEPSILEPTATTQSEFRRVFGEYLPVIEEQFKTDDDAAVRDRYLALAKFGAGLAAQPGGDLVGAIGKAAQKPLDDLSVIAAQQRKEKQTPKMLALQATLDTLKQDGKSSVDKQIDFQKLSKEAEGISQDGQVGYGEALMIAEAKATMGKEGGKYNSLYPDTEKKLEKIKGPKFFYTKNGDLKVVKDGETFTPEEWKNSPLNKE